MERGPGKGVTKTASEGRVMGSQGLREGLPGGRRGPRGRGRQKEALARGRVRAHTCVVLEVLLLPEF